MKCNYYLISLLILSSCSINSYKAPNYKDIVDDSTLAPTAYSLVTNSNYGPYYQDSNKETWSFSYKVNRDDTYEKVTLLNGNYELSSTRVNTHSYSRSLKKITFYYNFDPAILPKDKNITVKVSIYSSLDNSLLLESKGVLAPATNRGETYDISKIRLSGLDFSNPVFKLPSSGVTFEHETFTFKDTVSTFQNNDYYKLPLDGIYFEYKTDSPSIFTYKDAYLTFNNIDHLFDDVLINNMVKIPLTIKQNSNKITFLYREEMYVNDITLLMSNHPKENYRKTSVFYLPVNKASTLDKESFQIVIQECGKKKINLSIPLTYYALLNHFGLCDDSKFCIYGEVVE